MSEDWTGSEETAIEDQGPLAHSDIVERNNIDPSFSLLFHPTVFTC